MSQPHLQAAATRLYRSAVRFAKDAMEFSRAADKLATHEEYAAAWWALWARVSVGRDIGEDGERERQAVELTLLHSARRFILGTAPERFGTNARMFGAMLEWITEAIKEGGITDMHAKQKAELAAFEAETRRMAEANAAHIDVSTLHYTLTPYPVASGKKS